MQKAKIAFHPGSVVTGANFFGRSKEIDKLLKRLNNGQNILITGERRIGKTSLLWRVYELDHPSLDNHSKIWIDPVGATVQDFISDIIHSLAIAKDHSISIPEKLFSQGGSPSKIKSLLLKLLREISKDGKRLVLFINDLDDFVRSYQNRETSEELTSFLRSILDMGHVLACAISFSVLAIRNTSPEKPPLFNVFSEMTLSAFSEQEADSFLMESSERSGDLLLESECNFFTSLIGLIPFYLQTVGFNLFIQDGFINSTGKERLNYMTIAIDTSVQELYTHWYHALEVLPSQKLTILKRIAEGQPLSDDPDTTYLVQRGFIDMGENPFKSRGALYKQFLLSLDLDLSEKRHKIRSNYWSLASGLAQTAIKTLIESGIKTYLK